MGLDIYAGTLTRYYTRNWKTLTQKFAEENGMQFSTIRTDGERAEPLPTPDEAFAVMSAWRDKVSEGLTQALEESVPAWEENNDAPYETDKPDWDAFGALVLCCACAALEKPLPPTIQKNWDWQTHPQIELMRGREEGCGSLLRGVELWIPATQSVLFDYADPCGNEGTIGTTGGLLEELEWLNRMCWQADPQTIHGWRDSEGYPADCEIADGVLLAQDAPVTEYATESLAKFAFAMLYELTRFACDHHLPLKLDY